ncbi:MAG: phosphatase PAP2 family protein [Lachnospiraceae bacterium]|nr:phosphatase PAP2 family protein [Lachnospiraceae bacterium]
MEKIKDLCRKYWHGFLPIIYLPIYMRWFLYLEENVNSSCHIITTKLDTLIPFCEYFIIPYFLWFAYITVVGLVFFFHNREDFIRYCIFLFTGMSISLFVCTIWPNGLRLRPALADIGRDNVYINMVHFLYKTDTPTNVCPSIHVLNSCGAFIAVLKSETLKDNKKARVFAGFLSVSIILSTMFLKQHSCVDVVCAIMLSYFVYIIAYVPDYSSLHKRAVISRY